MNEGPHKDIKKEEKGQINIGLPDTIPSDALSFEDLPEDFKKEVEEDAKIIRRELREKAKKKKQKVDEPDLF